MKIRSGLSCPLGENHVRKSGLRKFSLFCVYSACNCLPCVLVLGWWNVVCLAFKSAMSITGQSLSNILFRSAYGMYVLGLTYVVAIIIGPWMVCIGTACRCLCPLGLYNLVI